MKELTYTNYKTKQTVVVRVNDDCGFYRFIKGGMDGPDMHSCYKFYPSLDLEDEKGCKNCPYYSQRIKKS